MSAPDFSPLTTPPSTSRTAHGSAIDISSRTIGVTSDWNSWNKDEKTKTCKCESCGDRVRVWSYKCTKCFRHICSECLDSGSSKINWEKSVAENHVVKGCWCMYRSNMNPEFRHGQPPPPIRTEEELRAKESKGLVAAGKGQGPSRKTHKSKIIEDTPSPEPEDDSTFVEPDKEYEAPEASSDATSKVESKRRGIKRKHASRESGAELSSTLGVRYVKKAKGTKGKERAVSVSPPVTGSFTFSNVQQLHGTSTIVVGAGFVGLWAARELALEAQFAGVQHNITVIDIQNSYCNLASGHCAGFLTTTGIPESWSAIADIAKESWQEFLDPPELRQRLRFSSTSLFNVTDNGRTNWEKAPAWLQGGHGMSILEDLEALGRLDARELAELLYQQCEILGVNFRFSRVASHARFTPDSRLSTVDIEDILDEHATPERIECHNLILAAGPFTTWIFNDLFENSPAVLENHVQGANWCQFDVDRQTAKDDIALRFPHAAADQPRLEDEITLVTNSANWTRTISALTRFTENEHLDVHAARHERKGKTKEMRTSMVPYLNRGGFDVVATPPASKGRSELSTANGRKPIIAKVHASGLGRICNDEEDQHPGGVWLCYGFGRYGTLLAPGAARILVEKILRRDTSESSFEFGVPAYMKPKGKGKRKG